MQQLAEGISITHADPALNGALAALHGGEERCERHFDQFGDLFLMLGTEYTVPGLPIHHDVRQSRPEEGYLALLRETVGRIAGLVPQVFRGLAYSFDPAENLRPCFWRLHRGAEHPYLYLLRLDLGLRPSEAEVVERGTSDVTARWKSRKLFLEPALLPLAGAPDASGGADGFTVLRAVSQTWIGEYGRGYVKQGIWMDNDLSRFFSRLFLPPGARLHPFTPLTCRYKTVCGFPIDLAERRLPAVVQLLEHALALLLPAMDRIQAELLDHGFSEDLAIFRELRARVPEAWYEPWRGLKVTGYLNENDRKEYRVDA